MKSEHLGPGGELLGLLPRYHQFPSFMPVNV